VLVNGVLVWAAGSPRLHRHPGQDGHHRDARLFGAVPDRQVRQSYEPGASVDHRADRRAAHPADDEVAVPVPDPGAVLDDDRAMVDQPTRRE
jgi:hypothetical protein